MVLLIAETKLAMVPESTSKSKQDKYTCLCCKVKFESLVLQKEHFKTQWHSYNLKRKICNLDTIDLVNFNEILSNERALKDKLISIETSVGDKDYDDDDDEDWEDIEQEPDKNEEERLLSRVIKSETCLFCGCKSADIKSNLRHMNSLHGFFIPEEQYLVDLEGYMEYLGFKVGAGGICLWCNKQFASIHGLRLHMISKNHCKILYDQEEALEFKEFYDYSSQEHIHMKSLNQLAIPRKRLARAQTRILVNPINRGVKNNHLLIATKNNFGIVAGSYQAKNIKKFEAYRAKIVLRTGMANNYTMRGRLRQQNPI